MKFSQLLKKFRERISPEMTQKKLAIKIGKKAPYISMIESGNAPPPPMDTSAIIADALNLSQAERNQFLGLAYKERVKDRDSDYVDAIKRQQEQYEQMISDMPGAVPAEDIPLLEWSDLPPPDTKNGGIMKYKLIINNDEMEPDFKKGHSIDVRPGVNAVDGRYVIAKPLKGDPILRLYKKRKNEAFLVPHNRDYPEISLRENPHKIIGIVLAHWRPLL